MYYKRYPVIIYYYDKPVEVLVDFYHHVAVSDFGKYEIVNEQEYVEIINVDLQDQISKEDLTYYHWEEIEQQLLDSMEYR